MRPASLKAFLVVVLALVAAACSARTTGTPSPTTGTLIAPSLGASSSNGPPNVTRDPQVIVDALDAAGLALCHSDYSDAAQYNIYGILGADANWRFFPHHTAVPIRSENASALSCNTTNQPNTGAIEIDVYPSALDASVALRQVGKIWLASWLYGNVAVVVDQTTPLPLAQQEGQVLDHLPGAERSW
jgi:hypothetical protein